MTDTQIVPPAVQNLLTLIKFRASYGRPCYLKRNSTNAALIVPSLSTGPDGPYEYLRTFRRTTTDEAIRLGLTELGPQLVDVPLTGTGTHWVFEPAHKGRTIALAGGGQ
jgi:hypothetical protein